MANIYGTEDDEEYQNVYSESSDGDFGGGGVIGGGPVRPARAPVSGPRYVDFPEKISAKNRYVDIGDGKLDNGFDFETIPQAPRIGFGQEFGRGVARAVVEPFMGLDLMANRALAWTAEKFDLPEG